MADETCMPACVLSITEINADIGITTKTKKQQIVLLFCWRVVHLFSRRKSFF